MEDPSRNVLEFGEEPQRPALEIEREVKKEVAPYDIFILAKWILGVATGIFVLFALIRIFATSDSEGIKEVWDYSKVALNSIVSLVLGLYFGSKQEYRRKEDKSA